MIIKGFEKENINMVDKEKENINIVDNSLILREVGFLIKTTRKWEEFSQKKLAQMSGCKQSQISDFEQGKAEYISVKTLGKIASALGKTLEISFK